MRSNALLKTKLAGVVGPEVRYPASVPCTDAYPIGAKTATMSTRHTRNAGKIRAIRWTR